MSATSRNTIDPINPTIIVKALPDMKHNIKINNATNTIIIIPRKYSGFTQAIPCHESNENNFFHFGANVGIFESSMSSGR